MPETLRCLKIRPLDQTVEEATLPVGAGQLDAIYNHIDASPIDVVRLGSIQYMSKDGTPRMAPKGLPVTIDVICDDEGLLKDESGESWPGYVHLEGHEQPLAGIVLIVAHDSEGNIVPLPTDMTAALFREHCTFPQIEFTHFTTETREFDHPLLGKSVMMTNTPQFRPRRQN